MLQAPPLEPVARVANAVIVRSPGYWSTVLRRFRRDPVAVGAGR